MEDTKNHGESKMFSENLLRAIDTKKGEIKTPTALKKICDGEPKNINPLEEIPKPQMRLYVFLGAFNNSAFFDTEEELIEWIKTHNTNLGNICIIDFLGNVAGCEDVIRITSRDGKSKFCTAVDEEGYGIYNSERSIYKGEFVWEYNHGSISDIHSAFRDRGIHFEDDIYAKIDERNQKIMQMFREKNLFNMGKK